VAHTDATILRDLDTVAMRNPREDLFSLPSGTRDIPDPHCIVMHRND
jgi:hypothetical protein